MADDIYTKYNIDITKLKRDYIKYPLIQKYHHYEKPDKDDFYYLYITLNLSLIELSEFFNTTRRFIIRVATYYKIKKNKR